ncbi:MAG: hypothetical protein KA760_08060 [Steroidobacteraceae bacterium]|jgi:hypothetical protein|nr:hypothetical protein [Steroidobacteraceae bacterium]MBP9130397.1 hypothetical protein [Steroidobacteraceae bacterium]
MLQKLGRGENGNTFSSDRKRFQASCSRYRSKLSMTSRSAFFREQLIQHVFVHAAGSCIFARALL